MIKPDTSDVTIVSVKATPPAAPLECPQASSYTNIHIRSDLSMFSGQGHFSGWLANSYTYLNAFYPDATQEQKLIITKLSLEADSSVYVFENDPTNSLEDLFELLELRYGNSQVDSKLSPVPVQTKQSIQALSNYPINFDSKSFADMLRSMSKFKGAPDENVTAWMLNNKSNFDTCQNLKAKQKIDAILIKVEEYPREILANLSVIQSADQCFEILEKTYGKDQRFLLANTKQLSKYSQVDSRQALICWALVQLTLKGLTSFS